MVNQTLTNLYKNILKSNGLVDSGDLINSIIVDMYMQNNTLFVNVKSLDYLKYLIQDYKLTQQFIDSPLFLQETENEFLQIIEESVNNILEGIPNNLIEPKLLVLYNGK